MLAAALAERHRKGFVPIRKQGKLPPPVVSVPYDLEYGNGVLEMQTGKGRLLLVDDVLATGGTMQAAASLCIDAGYEIARLMVLIDLKLVKDFRWEQQTVLCAIEYWKAHPSGNRCARATFCAHASILHLARLRARYQHGSHCSFSI